MLFTAALPDHLQKLRCIELFADCTTRELRRIDRLATIVRVARGHVLCRQGEIGRECFVILDGEADVEIKGRHFVERRGALLGEIALLTPGGRRTADVSSRTELTVVAFNRLEFSRLLAAIPGVAHKVVRQSARRLVEDLEF
jgi:CRP-like cAMP-binding protein